MPDNPIVKQFISQFMKLQGAKSARDMFRDFCEMGYCAYAKLTAPTRERADALEARYMRIVSTYPNKDTVRAYPELMRLSMLGVKSELDFFGTVAGEMSALNAEQGQFFTPIHVSRLMAKMMIGDVKNIVAERGFFTLQEPACGAGGMVLGAAQEVRYQSCDPSIHMLVHAIDINPLAYWMCYLQLTFAGVPAYVEHGNALSMEHFDGAWTLPAYTFQSYHGHLFPRSIQQAPEESPNQVRVPDDAFVPLKQLKLFED